ncbi:MAG: hypothetical protein ACLU3I_17470 [Acutalibacteraceae bacterium]
MKHRIVIRCEGRSLRDFALKQQISKCITAALAIRASTPHVRSTSL